MIGASLALAAALGQAPPPSPMDLVVRLGSARYTEREAAAKALEARGRQALPALRAVLDSQDPEVRTRASSLVQKIEGALLTQPTLVSLDFHDQPLPEVIKALNDRTGIRLALVPENAPTWAQTRITLQDSAPLPFWKAVDRLCDAAGLQYNAMAHGLPNVREPMLHLYAGGPNPQGPTSDQGPFRARLVSLHYQRDLNFDVRTPAFANRPGLPHPPSPARPGNPAISEQFFAQVQVQAEPRLSVCQSGPLKILEAVDDRGESLAIAPSGPGGLQRSYSSFGSTSGSVLQLQVFLRHPKASGPAIAKLRGSIPLVIATRKLNPLVVPLAGSAGKSFHNDEVNVTVRDIRINPDSHQTSIELGIRATGHPSEAFADPVAPGQPLVIHRPETHQQQIEVTDAQGRVIPWYHSSFDAEGSRFTLTLTPHAPVQATPTELRYYGLARASTEVVFEFFDVPMP
jgi:hypothetical protein